MMNLGLGGPNPGTGTTKLKELEGRIKVVEDLLGVTTPDLPTSSDANDPPANPFVAGAPL